jgi:hypothetical protein
MPKVKISEYSATANSNTDVASINIDEGCAPSGINNAIRAIMGHLKDFQQGTNGDPFNGPVNGTLGATTASTANVTTLTTSSTITHNGGTANCVAYLNGSKVLTTGSALVFDGSNLGLGVTPSAWASFKSIELPNGVYLGTFTGGGEPMYLGANNYFNGSNFIYKATGYATRYQQASGAHLWFNAPSGTAGNAITFTQAMTLDASGNLGIGVTSITQKLQVLGNISAFSSSNVGSAGSAIYYLGAADAKADAQFKYDSVTRNLSWKTAAGASDMMTLDASGNLLVGATSTLGSTAGILVANSGANVQALTTNSTSGSAYYIGRFYSGGTEKGYIYFDGTIVSYTSISDYRLKENVQPMQNALDKVAQLNPVTYSWKSNGKDGQGFIAHELQAVVPDCVTGDKDAVDEDGNPKYQGVDTSFLVATLTAAIQELNAKFEEYKAAHP